MSSDSPRPLAAVPSLPAVDRPAPIALGGASTGAPSSGPAHAAPGSTLHTHTLDNGLRVVLQRDTALPLVAINLWYHVGSKNERPGATGLAHLFEHLLFQGSQHVDTNGHFHHVQLAGGVANGSTWFDRTNYYETLPSHHLDLGLWLESDRMGFFLPAITPEKLENQRDVVMNERRQRVDNQPYGRANEALAAMLYPPGHPYSWPVIGHMADIEAATLEMVKDFFRTYYAPTNAVLTLVGDLEPDQALRSVERYFAEIPAGPEITRPRIEPMQLDAERRQTIEDKVRLPRVYMGYHGPPYGDREWYAGDLLAVVLGSGKACLLYQDLVIERQLAQNVSVYVLPTESTAMFGIIASAKPEVDPRALEAAIDEHLAAIAEGRTLFGSLEDQVERARNRQLTSHFDDLQSLSDRADQISKFATYFDAPEQAMTEIDRYRDLRAEDLQAFARDRLRPHHRAVVTVVPED